MRLVTLNTWGARVGVPFVDFIKKSQDIDIFCFQEIYDKATGIMDMHYPQVRHELLSELKIVLPDHEAYFRPVLAGVYGLAIFVRKTIPVLGEGEVQIHERTEGVAIDGHHDRNLQWIKIRHDRQPLTIINVHGLWNGKGKTDAPARIAQSQKIRAFVESVDGPTIICGDFNLNPDTQTLAMVRAGMRDLVAEYGVTSTRTSFYEKPGKFADYIFTSPGIDIKDFKVLPDQVSDHSALYLEIVI